MARRAASHLAEHNTWQQELPFGLADSPLSWRGRLL